jgi:CelD/BcsL family acetyltransferase involved in cellulose biosynthesis
VSTDGPAPPPTEPPWSWQVVRLHDARCSGLGPHAEVWSRLNDRLNAGHPMLGGPYVDALLRHFAPPAASVRLAIATGPSTQPLAMLLLVPVSGGLFWRSFMPAQTQLGPVLLPPQVRKVDITALLRRLAPHALSMELLSVDPDLVSLHTGPLGSAKPPGRDMPHAHTITISLRGGFEAYWASRSAGLRQNLRRWMRKAAELDRPATLTVLHAPDEMAAAVERYAELESRGWKSGAGTALVPGGAQAAFYAELLAGAASRGEALVYELRLGDRLAAMRLALRSGQRVVMLKTSYEPEFEQLAPGRLLLHESLVHLERLMPDADIEFCTHANADLVAWATSSRWVNHWIVRRNPQIAFDARVVNRLRRVLVPVRGPAAGDVAVHSFGRLDELPAEARRLLDSGEPRSIQFGSDWYRALVDAVFADADVRWLVQQRDDHVQAVLPMVLSAAGPDAGRATSLSNFYTALWEPALMPGVRAIDLVPLARAVRALRPPSGQFRFTPMDPASHAYKVWYAALSMAGLVPFGYFAFGNWYLDAPADWETYRAWLGSKLRNTIKRKGKQFAEAGGRIDIASEPSEMAPALAAFQHVYARSWKTEEPYPGFVPALGRRFSAARALRVGVAWQDGRPVAAQLWFVKLGRADIYKVAYDEEYAKYSVGTLVTAAMVERAIDVDRVGEVDYLIGDDAYKKTWMRHRRERWGIVAYEAWSWRGALGLAGETLGRIARRFRPKSGDGVPHGGPAAERQAASPDD